MPTENEFKYLVKPEGVNYLIADRYLFVEQGYLTEDGSVRVRSIRQLIGEYYLTYKKFVGDRLIEIETEINERDFKDLFSIATRKINKVRCSWNAHPGWTVDYLIKDAKCYIALAEVELPEGQVPDVIPDVIAKEIIYTVPQKDLRYCNSNLWNPEVAKCLIPWSKDGES